MNSQDESKSPRRLRIFLCHTSTDKPTVRDLYYRLRTDGFEPWLDEEDLLPGQDWQQEIPKAVRAADVVIVCLSSGSITRAGYVQKEISNALDVADEQPIGTIFIIPAKLEPCDVPDRLRRWHWVNLFEEKGYERLIRALFARSGTLGIAVASVPLQHEPPRSFVQHVAQPTQVEPELKQLKQEHHQYEMPKQDVLGGVAQRSHGDLHQHPLVSSILLPALSRLSSIDDGTLRRIVEQVEDEIDIKGWHDVLTANIRRASELTGLTEGQIRYFEKSMDIQSEKTDDAKMGRFYTIPRLRLLRTYALLLNEGYRLKDAVKVIKRNVRLIESGIILSHVLTRDELISTDGFMLSRIVSQILYAARLEVHRITHEQQHVIGLILPMRNIITGPIEQVSREEVQRIGREVCINPVNTLVALDRHTIAPQALTQISPSLVGSGSDDSTVLFYCRESWQLPHWEDYWYCLYVPEAYPYLAMVLIIYSEKNDSCPHILQPTISTRVELFNRLLLLCKLFFEEIQSTAFTGGYLYCIDGLQLEQTQITFQKILARIRALIFPEDFDSVAVLLIPNSLDQPTSLSILTHYGYNDDLAIHVKLSLDGAGEGLSGHAYKLGKVIFSFDASTDWRVAYAFEEKARAALAVPLTTGWSLAPFGVLYLATTASDVISSDLNYFVLILGNILSELLGNWWMSRMRKAKDLLFHTHVEDMVSWLDSLDRHGPNFQRAFNHVKIIWDRIQQNENNPSDTHLALAVLKIDDHQQRDHINNSELFSIKLQVRVREAIRKILVDVNEYWIENNCACLILDNYDIPKALSVIRRISDQVRASPPDIYDVYGKSIKFNVSTSAAIKAITHQALYDFDKSGGSDLYNQIKVIIDDLCDQTSSTSNKISVFKNNDWQTV